MVLPETSERRLLSQGKAVTTLVKFPDILQGGIDGDGGVQDLCCLPKTPLPGHMVGQLSEAVCHRAQIDAAVLLPAPASSPLPTVLPCPVAQGISMCLPDGIASQEFPPIHSLGIRG